MLSKHLPKTTTCGINKKIFDALCSKHNYWDIDSGLATFYSNEHRDTPKRGRPLEDLMQARLKIPVFTPFIHVEHYILYFFQFLSFWDITLFYVLSAASILLILPTYSVWMLFSWNDWKLDRSSENAIRWHTVHFKKNLIEISTFYLIEFYSWAEYLKIFGKIAIWLVYYLEFSALSR